MPNLIAVAGPLKGQSFRLQETVVLGRATDAGVRVDDLSVSRRHARVAFEAGRYVVSDLGSGNGTFVNGARIGAPTPLKDGDEIRLAGHVFRFAAEPAGARETGVTIVEETAAGAAPVVETLDIQATLMSVAARPAMERDALVKAQQRFRTVLEVSNAIQTQLDLDKLLNEIMERLFRVFPQADRGFVLLKGDEGEELVPLVSRQRGRDKAEAITISRSIVRKALENRVAVLSADAMSDQRFALARSVMNFQIRSMMCAPIIAHDDALGIIHLDTSRQDRAFTLDDLDLLAAVTNQTAFAIANARMLRKLLLQERTERDLQLARQVQESFLPRQSPEVPGMQFAATYKAALEVGGDFYDFIPLGEDRLAIVVGDVAGKGIPAALMMARMSSAAREFALTISEPREVVARLNARMTSMNAEGSFITLIFAVLDAKSRTVRMVNAAHPSPVLRRGATGEVSEIAGGENFPVGVLEEAEFEQATFHLEPGDLACFYSDGVTEAMNAAKELYGSERLRAAAARPAASAQELMQNVLADVHAHVAGSYQSDDLTLVCFGAA